MRIRTYTELRRFDTFEDRFEYLKLGGTVGHATFGFDRHVNQSFYHSAEWKNIRNSVVYRDNGCDLGVPGYEINGSLLIHHINPMGISDLIDHDMSVIDPEYLITTTKNTHNAIHYGDRSLLATPFVERTLGDTRLW